MAPARSTPRLACRGRPGCPGSRVPRRVHQPSQQPARPHHRFRTTLWPPLVVTPEYNFGPSAVLKNALDWVYPEWNRKAAAFVGYGSAAGARGVQQLRETAIELQLAPTRSAVIPVATLWAHFQGGDVD